MSEPGKWQQLTSEHSPADFSGLPVVFKGEGFMIVCEAFDSAYPFDPSWRQFFLLPKPQDEFDLRITAEARAHAVEALEKVQRTACHPDMVRAVLERAYYLGAESAMKELE